MKAQPKQLELTAFIIDDTLYYVAPIENYTGYWASTCGHILSTQNNEPIVLAAVDNGRGYVRVRISKDGKDNKLKLLYIHRLIAQTFYDFDAIDYEGHPRLEVNHINGIKTDNQASNLELCSRKENMEHCNSVLKEMKSMLGET